MSQKNQPVHEERLGKIKAAIWKNARDDRSVFNVTFSRLYRADDEWKEAQSFGRDDCLVLAQLAQIASLWIFRHQTNSSSDSEAA